MNPRPGSVEKRLTAHEYVLDALRNIILSGELSGGTRLIQSDLAKRLNVSTTPVREALRDLANEGLIHVDAHRGAVVHQVDAAEVREIYEIRRRLEPLVMELALERITETQMATARALHEEMERERDPVRWVNLNRDFHGVFMDACGWPRLAATVRSLHAGASPYVALTMRFRPEFMEKGNKDHGQILDACVQRDVQTAVELMVAHMDITKIAVEEKLGGPRTARHQAQHDLHDGGQDA